MACTSTRPRTGCVLVLLCVVALAREADDSEETVDLATRMVAECVELPFSLCSGRGRKLHVPAALPKRLAAHWTFDDMVAHDHSGRGNAMRPVPNVGPGRGGHGQSAYFNGSNYAMVEHAAAFETRELSVTYWLYLLRDSIGSWRTVLRKGDASTRLTPSFSLWPSARRLHVRVSTELGDDEGVDSVAIIPLRRWTHIAFVAQGKLLQLYINGVLDSQRVMKSAALFNRLPLYVGRGPVHAGTAMFLDELALHSVALAEHDVQAMAAPLLAVASPRFAKLGCPACDLDAAVAACSTDAEYHLCTKQELLAGAVAVARAQGWFHINPRVWPLDAVDARRVEVTDDAAAAARERERAKRLAICCANEGG